jgi:ABC-2 type transport system ATP-binding protein
MIEVRNLAFSYRRRAILRDVSFVVSPGEVVSVIGANGAGKTTLLKILATLAVPDEGQILLDGSDALAKPLRYRRQIGYLPELPALDDDMSVRDYLRYRANLKGEPARRVRRRVNEAAEICRVADLMRAPIRSLSLGLRKRVALADALLLRPRVLLLDDFLAGLDTSMRRTAGEILSSAAAFSSVIVTGHELSDFAQWTTRFIVLRDGVSTTVDAAGLEAPALRERLDAALEGGAR